MTIFGILAEKIPPKKKLRAKKRNFKIEGTPLKVVKFDRSRRVEQLCQRNQLLARLISPPKSQFEIKKTKKLCIFLIQNQFPLGAAAHDGSDSRRPINPERVDVVFFRVVKRIKFPLGAAAPIKAENLKVGGRPKQHRKSTDLDEWSKLPFDDLSVEICRLSRYFSHTYVKM